MNFNKTPNDPNLKDLLDQFLVTIMMQTNCHALATIQKFDPVTQLVTASINYKKTFFVLNEVSGNNEPVLQDYPLLIDCPVIIMSGGDFALRFPIKPGDTCLVCFNDRDMDDWIHSGQVGPVGTPRLHSFSDGIAIVGLTSQQNVWDDYDPDNVELGDGTLGFKAGSGSSKIFNGETVVETQESLINIANVVTSLGDVMTQLMTQLSTLTTALSAFCVTGQTNPTTEPALDAASIALAASVTAISAQLTIINTLQEDLLV